MIFNLLSQAILIGSAIAVPYESSVDTGLAKRQSFVPQRISDQARNSYTPFARFASAAYCLQSSIARNFTCGTDCQSAPGFQIRKVGGNNADSAPYFVGYDPRDLTGAGDGKGTVIVSHQGTPNLTQSMLPGELFKLQQKEFAGSPLFTNVRAGASAHSGFSDLHAATARDILASVQSTLAEFKTNKVVVTGHSLGAAISVISAIQLQQRLPTANVSNISFASPRVGNTAFAEWANENVRQIRHVNNLDDYVPVVPGRTSSGDYAGTLFGFVEFGLRTFVRQGALFPGGKDYAGQTGEIHIDADGFWYDCGPVRDNTSRRCSTGLVTAVNSEFFMQLGAGRIVTPSHGGPYNGVIMSAGCTAINPVMIV